MASCAIGSSTRFCARPDAMMSSGTGVGSVHTPFSWCRGFVTYPVPPTQVVEPGSAPLQYWVWMFAQWLPPTPEKNDWRYVCSVLLEYSFPFVSSVVKPCDHCGPHQTRYTAGFCSTPIAPEPALPPW